jgi:hypothetical protein
VAETTSLLNWRPDIFGTAGSNPALSASKMTRFRPKAEALFYGIDQKDGTSLLGGCNKKAIGSIASFC